MIWAGRVSAAGGGGQAGPAQSREAVHSALQRGNGCEGETAHRLLLHMLSAPCYVEKERGGEEGGKRRRGGGEGAP